MRDRGTAYGVRLGIGRTVTVLEAGVGHVGRELHRLEHSRRHRRHLEIMTTNNESNDITIQFFSFDGCPNAAQTRENLGTAPDELGLKIEPEVIDVDPSTCTPDQYRRVSFANVSNRLSVAESVGKEDGPAGEPSTATVVPRRPGSERGSCPSRTTGRGMGGALLLYYVRCIVKESRTATTA